MKTKVLMKYNYYDPNKLKIKNILGIGRFGCVFDATYDNHPSVFKTSIHRKDDLVK